MNAPIHKTKADTARAIAEALRKRAVVSDVALKDVVARRRVTEAKVSGGFGATVQASLGFNATASQASSVYRNLREARQFAVSVQVPLWQWGAHGSDVRAAEADRAGTTSRSQATLAQTAQDAHFAALGLSQARRTEALVANADTVAAKRFELAYNRSVTGRIMTDNLYIGQNEKDQARAQFVQGLRNYWHAYYWLRRVTLFDFTKGQPIR